MATAKKTPAKKTPAATKTDAPAAVRPIKEVMNKTGLVAHLAQAAAADRKLSHI